MTTLSVTRALAELKLYDKKINDQIDSFTFGCIKTPTTNYPNNKTREQYVADEQGALKSIQDLIANRSQLKTAIMVSNASTFVMIGNTNMTVAAAIEQKQSIGYKLFLLQKLQKEALALTAASVKVNEEYQKRLDVLLKDKKGSDIRTAQEAFDGLNKAELIDTIGYEKVIKDLTNEIDTFNTEVDFILSESNAKTDITITKPELKP
jgi:hypothetical protein